MVCVVGFIKLVVHPTSWVSEQSPEFCCHHPATQNIYTVQAEGYKMTKRNPIAAIARLTASNHPTHVATISTGTCVLMTSVNLSNAPRSTTELVIVLE
jgi:hypothetical protein